MMLLYDVFSVSVMLEHIKRCRVSLCVLTPKNNASTCIFMCSSHRVTQFVCVLGIKKSSWFVFGTVRDIRPSRLRAHWRTLRSRWSSARRRPMLTWNNRSVEDTYLLLCQGHTGKMQGLWKWCSIKLMVVSFRESEIDPKRGAHKNPPLMLNSAQRFYNKNSNNKCNFGNC